jgi:hypothetical protein
MELQNSYIFIPKGNPDGDDCAAKISELIDRIFPNVISVSDLIGGGCRGYINGVHVTFVLNETPEADYFDVIVKHHYKAESVKCLEDINHTIMHTKNDFQKQYVPIISFDSVSEYYCNRIHPKLNELDRKLRQLNSHLYAIYFGHNPNQSETQDELKEYVSEYVKSHAELEEEINTKDIKAGIRMLQKFSNQTSRCNFFYEQKFNKCLELTNELLLTADAAIRLTKQRGTKLTNESYAEQMNYYIRHMKEAFRQLEAFGDNICSLDKIAYVDGTV